MENKVADIMEKANNAVLENTSKEKYLTFFIDEQNFAIPSSLVVEIIRMQPITYMPKLPPYIKGVINLRGKIVPLVDLRLRFKKPLREYDEHTSIVVVDTSDISVGFIVDGVNDVTDISVDQITDAPKLSKDSSTNFVMSIATLENQIAMLLDINKVLTDNTYEENLAEQISAEANS